MQFSHSCNTIAFFSVRIENFILFTLTLDRSNIFNGFLWCNMFMGFVRFMGLCRSGLWGIRISWWGNWWSSWMEGWRGSWVIVWWIYWWNSCWIDKWVSGFKNWSNSGLRVNWCYCCRINNCRKKRVLYNVINKPRDLVELWSASQIKLI